jgi:hypothetical protein
MEISRVYGPLVSSIKTVVTDMITFLVILGVSIIAFGGTFFILDKNKGNEDEDIIDSIKTSFEWTLGNYDTSGIKGKGIASVT